MARGSQSGWFGWPKDQRVCAGCGKTLTLKDAPLWFEEMRHRVWHFDCWFDYLGERARKLRAAEIEELRNTPDEEAA